MGDDVREPVPAAVAGEAGHGPGQMRGSLLTILVALVAFSATSIANFAGRPGFAATFWWVAGPGLVLLGLVVLADRRGDQFIRRFLAVVTALVVFWAAFVLLALQISGRH